MSDKYFSRVYRGWTLQQTDRGWIIVNAPNRDKSGPISPGPYSTFGIAEHVVDRIMDNSYGPNDNPRNQNTSKKESSGSDYSFLTQQMCSGPVTWEAVLFYVVLFLGWAVFHIDTVKSILKVLFS